LLKIHDGEKNKPEISRLGSGPPTGGFFSSLLLYATGNF
jgi:hypothetical protein